MTRAIVEELMSSLHGYGAGVVRAAKKRGHSDRTNLAPLQDTVGPWPTRRWRCWSNGSG